MVRFSPADLDLTVRDLKCNSLRDSSLENCFLCVLNGIGFDMGGKLVGFHSVIKAAHEDDDDDDTIRLKISNSHIPPTITVPSNSRKADDCPR